MSIKKIDKETGDIGNLIAGGTLFADSPLLTVVSSYDTVAAPGWKLLTTDVAGRTLSRTEYKELFDLVTERGLIGEGKPFGEGDGSTTFVLPDLSGEFIRGAGTNSHSGQGDGGTVGQHQDATELPICMFRQGTFVTNNDSNPVANNAPKKVDKEIPLATADGVGIDNTLTGTTYSTTLDSIAYTVKPTNTSLNYFMKVKMVSVPADFVSAMDKIYGVLIPSDASPTNKLVAKSDVVIRHNYSITGTADAVEDTKALVNHIATLDVGTYAGEFKRSGVTFGSYRLTCFIDGIYAKSVSGIVTYSIGVNTDATYQVSYVEDIEHGTPPEYKIEKLAIQPNPQVYSNAITPASGISTARNSIIVNGNLVFLSLFLYGPNNIPCDGSVVATISNASLRPKFDIVFSIIVSPRFGTEGQPATLTISADGGIKIAANGDPTVGEVYTDGLWFPL